MIILQYTEQEEISEASPDSAFRGPSRGMLRLVELLAMLIVNDAVNLNNDMVLLSG